MVASSSTSDILVIGAGSIGRRHAANLTALGVHVHLFDVAQDMVVRLCDDQGYTAVYDLKNELLEGHCSAAIVCTPNHLHIPVAMEVAEAGLHLFIEKPLSHTYEGVNTLINTIDNRKLIAMAGFNLRFEPGLRYIRSHLDPQNVAFAHMESGSHMPSWRAGTDYRKTYSANRSMGGGIILDDVHELDYVCWLFGYPEEVSCEYGQYSNFKIDVEDTADFHFRYQDKSVTIHSDYLQRRYTRTCKICMKDGYSIEWVFGDHVTIQRDDGAITFNYKENFEINDLYLQEMKEFLRCVQECRIPESDLENAAKILRIALRAKGEL